MMFGLCSTGQPASPPPVKQPNAMRHHHPSLPCPFPPGLRGGLRSEAESKELPIQTVPAAAALTDRAAGSPSSAPADGEGGDAAHKKRK